MSKKACPNQCRQCPFRSTSAPGWLGGYMAEDIPSLLWHGQPFFCHTRTNYRSKNWREKAERNGVLCMGALVASERFMAPESTDAEVSAARSEAVAYASEHPEAVDVMDVASFLSHHRDNDIARNWRASQAADPLLRGTT